MTKYVLNSGGLVNNPDGARRFFAELVKDLGPKPRILLCSFAQPREVWEEKYESYKAAFDKFMPEDIKAGYEMAMPETFAKQVAAADAIYCHGGDDHLAMYWFQRLDVANVWIDK